MVANENRAAAPERRDARENNILTRYRWVFGTERVFEKRTKKLTRRRVATVCITERRKTVGNKKSKTDERLGEKHIPARKLENIYF